MTQEELERAFDRWASAVKAAELDPLQQHLLNLHVAAELRQLPDPSANKGGQPTPLQGVAADLEGLR